MHTKTLLLFAVFVLAFSACGGVDTAADSAAAGTPPPGGSPPPASPPPPNSPPTSTANFVARCQAAGVLKCVGFDNASDIQGTYGDNSGLVGNTGELLPALDTSIKASGASSLKFTIPTNSGSGMSGSYFTNFSSDLSVLFGENQEFFIQWRQRFSPEFLNTFYASGSSVGGGWKQAIISAGDKPGCTASTSANGTANGVCNTSCTALETVVQNVYQRGFPQMYNSCTGSTSHQAFDGFEEHFGSSDFKIQNARPAPFCLYSQGPNNYFPPNGNCFGYFPNEWLTYQVRIKTGTRVGDEWPNSFVTLWIGRQGSASQTVITWGPYALSAGSSTDDKKFGKVWLLPYHTDKPGSQAHPEGYTWYDELIISRTQIADPQ